MAIYKDLQLYIILNSMNNLIYFEKISNIREKKRK
jgi:hypothetical protein